MAETNLPKSLCLKCGAVLNDAFELSGDAVPRPGDLSACLKCGAVMIFDESMKLRGFTKQEAEAVSNNPELMRSLGNTVKAIHLARAKQN